MDQQFEPDQTHSPIAESDAHLAAPFPTQPPKPFVTYAILAINVIVFAAMLAGGVHPLAPTVDSLVRWGANFGPLTITSREWWRMLTSMFLHIGVVHLAFNMYVLIQIGPFIERLLGAAGFSIIYFASGLAGALASLAWNPYVVSAGASGAIFGLYGALLGFLLIRRHAIPPQALSALTQSALIFRAFNGIYGVLRSGTDVAAHAGGLLGGFVCGVGLSFPPTVNLIPRRTLHNAAVAVAAALLILGTALALPHPIDLRSELQRFASVETQTLTAYNAILNRTRTDRLRDEQFADLVEKNILPKWNAERDSLAKLTGLPAKQKSVVSLLLNYMDARRDAWTVLVRGLRQHDLNAVKQAFAKQQEADGMAKKMTVPPR
jgi:rhomboid protease GluP